LHFLVIRSRSLRNKDLCPEARVAGVSCFDNHETWGSRLPLVVSVIEIYQQLAHVNGHYATMFGMKWPVPVWILAASVVGVAQPVPTINLQGRLELVDTDPYTTPVSALDVALHSPVTFAVHRGHPNRNGNFELTGVRPGHYVLELSVPSRLLTFTIAGRTASPAGFDLMADEKGPVHIVLSMKTGTLAVDVTDAADTKTALIAVLSPDDEYLTLRSQISNHVSAGQTVFRFRPPGKYLLFIADADLERELGTNAKLRDALKERAIRVEVFAEVETRFAATYIDRQTVDAARRRVVQ